MANEFAWHLRKNQTEAESKLWSQLRGEQLKHKFRRQAPIGRYIADFVCFEERLLIELDGSQHAVRAEYDKSRTLWLNGQRFRVLRFWNSEVFDDLEVVVDTIARALDDPLFPPMALANPNTDPPPQPSPTRGEGVNQTDAEQTDEAFFLRASPLELVFEWDGIRFRHLLKLNGSIIAASVEWDPDRDDPAQVVSPSYQQIGCDTINGTQRAMLVGQWGRHHGSAAFVMAESEAGVVIDVDVAVRSHAALDALACTYTVDRTSSDLVDANPTAIGWTFEEANGVLWFETSGPGERVGLAEAGRRATRVQVGGPIMANVATQRLRYRWRWMKGPV